MVRHCLKHSIVATGFALLSACGGGSGGSSSPPVATVQLAISSGAVTKELAAGDEIDVVIDGNWSGSNLNATDQVFLNMRDPAGRLSAPETRLLSAPSAFHTTLSTTNNISSGSYSGAIEVRACKDVQCTIVYPGATATVPYTFKVNAVADWETHQRDASHRGYVPITLKPARFAFAWQWQRPGGPGTAGEINPVVAADNTVYLTTGTYFGEGTLHALAEDNGSEKWRRSVGTVPAMGPPAVSNGRVYAPVTGHENTALWAFHAGSGDFLFKSAFFGQWPHVMAPTVHRDRVYTGAGYYGGETYAFTADTGLRNWTHSSSGVWDMFTPAVDDNFVYHYNGLALFLIDPVTGTRSASISDPFGKDAQHSYHGAPVLGGRKNAIALAGGAFSGRASSSAEQYEQRVLSSFDLEKKTFEWASASAYMTAPAVANGVIYAARNAPMSLDAMDEATGKVLWSWTPAGTDDTSFHRNIVVTNNLLFVSTDQAVIALDLATRTPVWRYPKPGMLAISAGRTLYIATGARESDGGLVAIKLK